MRIGQFIKATRLSYGMTIKELSKLSGVHEVQISRYENDKYFPSHSNLKKLSKALKINLSSLDTFSEDEDAPLKDYTYNDIVEIIKSYNDAKNIDAQFIDRTPFNKIQTIIKNSDYDIVELEDNRFKIVSEKDNQEYILSSGDLLNLESELSDFLDYQLHKLDSK